MGRLEDEIGAIRQEIEALRSGYEQPKVLSPEDEERMKKVIDLLARGEEVPDELLEEPKEGAIMSERDFLPVLKKTIEDFGPYPDDEADASSTRS
jgi:hypothetical protein